MREQTLYYDSIYSVQECIARIVRAPQQYRCDLGGELWYSAEKISGTQVWITFKGGQYRKIMRTQYLMEFVPREGGTMIVMRFQKELLRFPPMAPTQDIDRCMAQKLDAVRRTT